MAQRTPTLQKRGRGRPVSLPLTIFGTLVSLRAEGLGYRAISNRLAAQGVFTSKSSVERCYKLLGAYAVDATTLRSLLP